MKESLLQHLSHLRKKDLTELSRSFGLPSYSNLSKEEIVNLLTYHIENHAEELLEYLTERDLRLAQKIVETGPEVAVDMDNPDFPTAFSGFDVFLKGRETDEPFYFVPKVFYDMIAPHISGVIRKKEESGQFDIERLVLGYVNLWGVITLRDFIKMLVTIIKDEEHARNILTLIAESAVTPQLRTTIDGEIYFVSPMVEDAQAILDARKDFEEFDSYKPFTLEEARNAGIDPPFCCHRNEESKKVERTFEALGFHGESAKYEVNQAFMNSQFAMTTEGAELLFKTVSDMMEFIPSFELYRDYMNTLADYANSAPKWLLKGRSANEAGVLKICIKIEDMSEEYEPGDLGEIMDELPQNSGKFAQVPSAGGLSDFFPYGFSFSHVAADAPCPCGSGLSYRRCHGKHLN